MRRTAGSGSRERHHRVDRGHASAQLRAIERAFLPRTPTSRARSSNHSRGLIASSSEPTRWIGITGPNVSSLITSSGESTSVRTVAGCTLPLIGVGPPVRTFAPSRSRRRVGLDDRDLRGARHRARWPSSPPILSARPADDLVDEPVVHGVGDVDALDEMHAWPAFVSAPTRTPLPPSRDRVVGDDHRILAASSSSTGSALGRAIITRLPVARSPERDLSMATSRARTGRPSAGHDLRSREARRSLPHLGDLTASSGSTRSLEHDRVSGGERVRDRAIGVNSG